MEEASCTGGQGTCASAGVERLRTDLPQAEAWRAERRQPPMYLGEGTASVSRVCGRLSV